MKAILVVDMPKECFECPFRYNDGYSSEDKSTWFIMRCHLSHDQVHENEILENCPLKSMPQELPTPYMMRQIMIAEGIQTEKPPYTEDYQKGYNDCISEILGE